MDFESLQFALTDTNNHLDRIATALETLASNGKPASPNYTRPIEQFHSFDWESIHAAVIRADNDGPTHVEWGGETWTRRSPVNKFGAAIWYSRANGKDEEGSVLYLRLITFKEMLDADPLPNKVRDEAGKTSSPKPATSTAVIPSPVSTETIVRSPEEVLAWINQKATEFSEKPISDKKRGVLVPLFNSCFKISPPAEASNLRHKVTKYLTGHESLTDVPDNYLIALYLWLNPAMVDSVWQPLASAVEEAKAIAYDIQKAGVQETIF
jgi:hypothetical protein